MASFENTLRLGTRGSLLARTQSGLVAQELMRVHPGLKVELVFVKTTGDQVQNKPLADVGGKGLFTKELELALLANEVDFAVHSFKDVPVTMPLVDQADLVIAAVPKREDPRDVLATLDGRGVAELPKNARVATGSMRRGAQILDRRPDVSIEGIRGNIDTRLRKLREDGFAGVVLAMAGLRRASLFDERTMRPLDPDEVLPAAAQGALALQCRKGDARTRELLGAMNDPTTAACVEAERAVVLGLEGDCHSPIAALAVQSGGAIDLRVAVARRGGRPPVLRARAAAPADRANEAVGKVLEELLANGASRLLREENVG